MISTPGTQLNILVGGTGGSATGTGTLGGNGGWNGGGGGGTRGKSGAGGGGATDVRVGGTAAANRIIVAGGGGGAAYYNQVASGGNGGAPAGQNGNKITSGNVLTIGGGGAGAIGNAPGLSPNNFFNANGTATGGGGGGQSGGFGLPGIGGGAGGAGGINGSGPTGSSGGGGGGYAGGAGGTQTLNVGMGGGGGSGYVGGVTSGTTTMFGQPGFVPNPDTTGNGYVIITPLCPVTLNSIANPICIGKTTTLSTSALSNYSWSTGATIQSIIVSPTITTAYSISGTNTVITALGTATCSGFSMLTVTVVPLPTVNIATLSNTICPGHTVMLVSSGNASTYTIHPGSISNPTAVVSPTVNTTYTVSGTNANGCVNTANVTQSVVSTTTVSLSPSSHTICSGSTVSIGATGAATYTWLPGGFVGNTFTTTLSNPAVYTVTGTSSLGCTGSANASVTIQAVPSLSFNTASITCASLGSATVNSTGGIGPYSYTWVPTAQTNSVATGLNPGIYTLTVFDAGTSCNSTATSIFTSLIPLTGTLISTSSLTCPAATNGTALFSNFAGGSGSENYIWTNGLNTYTVGNPQNLTAGQWSVTVTDALTACQVHSVFTITEPPAFTLSIAANTPSVCLGGSIVVTGTNSGGTPGYSYNWINGPPSSSYTVAENSSGTFVYTLSAVDANTCAVSNTIAVDFVPNPVISIPTVSICPLETATLVASGAGSYTWTGNVSGSTFTISPPATGNHSYAIAGSALGCVSTATGIVHVKSPPLVLLNSNSPVCEGGQLSLFATGGPGYQWTGPLAFTSTVSFPVITGALPAHSGVYNVTVTGVNGCTATASTPVLTVHPTPTLSATGATLCSSQTLVLNGSSVPGASFLWKGPLNFSSAVQNPVISNPPVSASGDYTLKVTSAQSCTAGAVAHVSVVPPPSLTVALSSPSLCAQAFNGSPNTITLTSSGADTYTLFTSSPVVSNDPNNPSASLTTDVPYLPAGISTATLVGSNGICEVSQTSTFSVIGNPTISIGSPTPVICAGENYTYTSHGADSYVWTSTTPNFTTYSNGGLAVAHPSIHSVFSVYGSSLGCNSALETSTITVNPIPSLSVTASQSAVCRFSQATLKATGNVTGFDWYPQLLMDAYSGNSATVTITADQVYTVTGSALGCTASAVALIRALDLPVAQISQSKHAYCIGEQVTLTGNGGLYYHWSGPHTFYRDGQVLSLALDHAGMAGVYTLVVTDKNGCRASALEEVTVIPFPFIQIAGPKSGCAPWCGEFELLGEHLSSSWQSGAQTIVQDENRIKLCFSKSGNYIVNGTITDQNTKCKTTQSFVVNVYEKPAADFTWLPEKPIAGIDEVLLLNNSTGQEQTRWRWYMEQDPAFRAETENTSYFFPKEGSYPIVYIVKNAWNCADTIIKILDIEADFVFYMPDAFTPNADSRNETFKPVLNGVTKYRMEVFNRWGERLFFTEDPEAGWDGYHQGQPCKQDSYVWRVVLTNVAGEQKSYNGVALLLK